MAAAQETKKLKKRLTGTRGKIYKSLKEQYPVAFKFI